MDRERAPDSAKNPQDRIADAQRLEPAERERALAAIAWDALERDQTIAHEAFQKLSPDSPEKIPLIRHYAISLATQDIDGAIAWADSLGTEKETSAALGQIAVLLAETDPLRAGNLLSESGVPGRDFDVAVVQVIQRWAAKSPPAAAEWVAMFSPGQARKAGVSVIADRWLRGDAAEAFRWFDSIKDPAFRKEAALAMEEVVLQQDRETSEAWLHHANSQVRSELELQRDRALKNMGNNAPQPLE